MTDWLRDTGRSFERLSSASSFKRALWQATTAPNLRHLGFEPLEQRQLLTADLSFMAVPFSVDPTTQNLVVNYNVVPTDSSTSFSFSVALVAVDANGGTIGTLMTQSVSNAPAGDNPVSFGNLPLIEGSLASADYGLKVQLDPGNTLGGQHPDNTTMAYSGAFKDGNGIVEVEGTAGGNWDWIREYGTNSALGLSGTVSGWFSSVQKLHIRTLGGNDLIQLDANVTIPTAIYGRDSTDRVTIDGTTNSDTFLVNDNSFTLNSNSPVSFSGIGSLALTAGGSPMIDGGEGHPQVPGPDPVDTFNVTQPLSTAAPMPVISVAGSGNDILNLSTAANTGQTVSVSNTQVSVANTAGTTTVTFSGVPTLNVTAAAGDTGDTFNVTESMYGDLLPSVHLTAAGGSSLVIDDTADVAGFSPIIGIDATKVSIGSHAINYTSFNGITVNTSGSKVFTVTEPATAILPTLTLGGGSGTNQLMVTDTASASNQTVRISSSAVTIGATPTSTINYTSINGGLTVNTGSGSDAFTVTEPATGIFLAQLILGASSGTDSLTIDDTAPTANQTVGISGSAVTIAPAPSINFTSFDNITVNTGSGSDAFTVTKPATATFPTLTLGADGGTNSLTIAVTALSINETVGIGASAVTIGPTPTSISTINYTSFNGGITVNTSTGDDTFTVTEPATGTLPTLTLGADGGTNSLTIDDTLSTTNQTVGIGASTITIGPTPASTINYTSFNGITVNTHNGGDTFTVTEPANSTLPTLMLGADGGSDALTVLDTAAGASPQAVGIDNVKVTIGATPTSTINYTGLESITVNTVGADDVFTITQASALLLPASITVNADGGNDTLNVVDNTAAGQPVTIDSGKVTLDSLNTFTYSSIENLNVTTANRLITINESMGTTLPPLIGIHDSASITPVVTVNTGTENDLVTVVGSQITLGRSGVSATSIINVTTIPTKAIDLYINTGAGDDTVTLTASSAINGCFVDGGTDSDTFAQHDQIGKDGSFIYSSVNNDLKCLITAVDTFNIEHIALDQGGLMFPFSISRSNTPGIPSLPVNWSLNGSALTGLASVDLALDGTQAIKIPLQTLNGPDTFTYNASAPGAGSSSLTTIDVTGSATNNVTIVGTPSNDVFDINGNTVRVNGGPLISFTGVGGVSFQGDGGNDTFTVTEPVNSTLPTLNILADGGSDTLIVNDMAAGSAAAQVVGIDSLKVTIGPPLTPTSTITYTGLENIKVQTDGAGDSFTVTEPGAGALPTLNLDGGSDFSFDTLIVDDTAAGSATAQVIGIDSLKVTIGATSTPTSTINYANLENITVQTDGAGDAFTVTEPVTNFFFPTTLPTLNLSAGTGTDTLIVNDTAAGASPQAVGIDNLKVTIGASPTSTINYTGLESITVNTGGADDVFTITQASASLLLPASITVNADGGYDTLNVVDNTAGQPVTIDNGKVMLDSLNTFNYSSVENLNVTMPNPLTTPRITINESTGMTLPPSIGINDSFSSTSVVTVNTGAEDDLVTVVGAQITLGRSGVSATSIISVTAHATDLYINTNAGNDTVTLTISPVLNSCRPNGGDGSDTFILHDQSGRDGSFSYNNANNDLACAITAVATTYMEHIALDQGGLAVPFLISHVGAPVPWSLDGSKLTGLPSVDLTLDGTQVFSLALSGSDTFSYNGSAPGIGSASLATINVTGNSTNSVTISGTSGDDVFEINGNTVSVNGGPLISFNGVGAVSFKSDGGNDTFHVRARPTMSTSFDGSSGSLDTVDFSGVNMSGVTLPSMTGIDVLNLSHASLSAVPTLPSGITTLDLRYDNLNLSNSTMLNALSSQTFLRQLDLYGNPSLGGDPDLAALKGMLLRVDLAPVGLQAAENAPDLATALSGIDKALHYLPLEIYDYVLNNYAFQLYKGFVKGDAGTIRTHAGNDADLAQLLADLFQHLNVSGLGSNIKTTEYDPVAHTGGVEITYAQAMQWLGATDPSAAYSALLTAYNGNVKLDNPSKLFVIPHTWLEVTMPDNSEKNFDPSWKLSTMSSNVSEFLAQYNLQHTTNYTNMGALFLHDNPNDSFAVENLQGYDPFVQNPFFNPTIAVPPTTATKLVAYEWFEDQVSQWLATNAPGITLADLDYDRVINPTYTTVAPTVPAAGLFWLDDTHAPGTTTPYLRNVNANTDYNWIRVYLKPSSQPTLVTTTNHIDLRMADVGQQAITVRWPTPTTPQLFVGETEQIGITIPSADGLILEFGFIKTGTDHVNLLPNNPSTDLIGDKQYPRAANTVMAIGLEANQISTQMINVEQQQVNTDLLTVVQTAQQTGLVSGLSQVDEAHLLALAVDKFFLRTDQGQDAADAIFHTVQVRNFFAAGVASADTPTAAAPASYHPTFQIPIVPQNLLIDIGQNFARSWSADFDQTSSAQCDALISASSSSQESGIWEELVNNQAMSTVTSVQIANTAFTTVQVVTPANWSTVQTTLNNGYLTPDDAMQNSGYTNLTGQLINEITGLFQSGIQTIVLPLKETVLNGWHGVGFFTFSGTARGWIILGRDATSHGGVATPEGFVNISNILSGPGDYIGFDPVDVANLGVRDDVTDINIPNTGIPLSFSRHYDSTLPGESVLGAGWYGSYSDQLTITANTVTWRNNQGQALVFDVPSSGVVYPLDAQNLNELPGIELNKVVLNGATSYVIRYESGLARSFNGSGVLTSILDLNGNSLTINHNGTKISTIQASSETLTFAYDVNGNLDTISATDGRVWNYSVTMNGSQSLLSEVASPIDTTTSATSVLKYTYYTGSSYVNTPLNNLLNISSTVQRKTGFTDVTTSSVTHTYYDNGRAFQATNLDGTAQSFDFNQYLGRTTATDANGHSTQYDFDAQGHQLRFTYPDRTTVKNTWSSNQLQTSTDTFGVTTTYAHDTLGNVTSATKNVSVPDPISIVPLTTTYDYPPVRDATGALRFSKPTLIVLPSSVSGARNTTNHYDPINGNLTSTVVTRYNPLDGTSSLTTTYTYYPTGLLKTQTDPRGNGLDGTYTTTYAYDGNNFGLPHTISTWISATDTSAVTTFGYNGFGYRTSYQDPDLNTTNYIVDVLGRTTRSTAPTVVAGQAQTNNVYDERGDLVMSTDPLLNVIKYAYDSLQRLTAVAKYDASGNLIQMLQTLYDAGGNVLATTDGLGNVTRYNYDSRDNRVQTIFADNTSQVSFYNGAKEVVTQFDANQNVTLHGYDQLGRDIRMQQPSQDKSPSATSQTQGAVWHYAYDAVGNRTSVSLFAPPMPGASLPMTDDTPTEVFDVAGGATPLQTTTYTYNSTNQLVRRVDPNPGSGELTPQRDYTYDAVGNQLTAKLSAQNSTAFTAETTTNTYDGLNRLKTQLKADQVTNVSYQYDHAGNLLFSTDGRGIITQYHYDALNRLSNKTVNYDQVDATKKDSPETVYAYDLVGNLQNYTLQQSGAAVQSKMSYIYDGLNRKILETHYDSNLTTVLATSSTAYDAAGNVVLSIDPLGHVTRFEYDARNRNTKIVNALGAVSTTTYDVLGNVLKQTDASSHVTTYTYDNLSRPTRIVLPDPDDNRSQSGGTDGTLPSPVTRFEYDPATGDLTRAYVGSANNELQRQTDYTYDNLHRRITTQQPAAVAQGQRLTTHATYDVAGNMITSTDQGSLVTIYQYDVLSRLTLETDPDPDPILSGGTGPELGRVFVYHYDGDGNLDSSKLQTPTGAILQNTGYVYDRANRQTDVKRYAVNTAGGFTVGDLYSTTSAQYDAAGNLTLSTDAIGRKTKYFYDGLNRVIETQQLDPTLTQVLSDVVMKYDANSNLVSSTNAFSAVTGGGFTTADDRKTVYYYDALNRQTRVTDPLTHSTATTYDAVGNVVSTTDPLGNTTQYTYDDLNRQTVVTDPLLNVTTTAYDEVGNVTSVTDPKNNQTSYSYDGLDRKKTEQLIDPATSQALAGGTRTYAYDARNQLQSETDRDNRVRELIFDAYGRETQETWHNTPGGPVTETLNFMYDPDGKLISAGDQLSSITDNYSSDPIRRLASTTTDLLNTIDGPIIPVSITQTNSYNLADELTQTSVTGLAGTDSYSLNYSYDALGRLKSVGQGAVNAQTPTSAAPIGAQFDWDPASELLQTRRYNAFSVPAGGGTQPNPAGSTTSQVYDSGGRLTSLAHVAAVGASQGNYSFNYDADNRITRSIITIPSTTGNSTTLTNDQYDTTSQLKTADHFGLGLAPAENYNYDANGNRTGPSYDPKIYNRLLDDGTFTYTFDNEGNLLTKTRKTGITDDHLTTYAWDNRNRLTSVTQKNNSLVVTKTISYTYDAFDRRINDYIGDSGIDFVYNGNTLMLTAYHTGSVIDRFLSGPSGQMLADDAVAYYTAYPGGTFVPAQSRWLLTDQEGSVRRVIDQAGADLGDVTYDSFGKVIGATTPAAAGSLFGYAGSVYDSATGLDYMNARYYDPNTGRFLSEDPTGFAGGDANLYRYVGNNPVNFTDPTGLKMGSLGGVPINIASFNSYAPAMPSFDIYNGFTLSPGALGTASVPNQSVLQSENSSTADSAGRGIVSSLALGALTGYAKVGQALWSIPRAGINALGFDDPAFLQAGDTAIENGYSKTLNQSDTTTRPITALAANVSSTAIEAVLGIELVGPAISSYAKWSPAGARIVTAVGESLAGTNAYYSSQAAYQAYQAGNTDEASSYATDAAFSGLFAAYPTMAELQQRINAPNNLAQVTINRQAGLTFQQEVTSALGAQPAGRMTGTTLSGAPYTTIPDAILPNGGLLEAKSGQYISYSPQLQAQVNIGRQAGGVSSTIVVGPNSTVSGNVLRNYGNGNVLRFDPATGRISYY